jgi:hypothetical protein
MRKPKPSAKKNRRPLADITRQIHAEERASVFKIGKLLIEAKDQLEHGMWLPYLKDIGWEARAAQLYMAVASLATKYENISHLDAALTALYALTWLEENAVPLAIERLKKSVARKDNASVQRRTVELSALAFENPKLSEIALEGMHEAINRDCDDDPVLSEAMQALASAIKEANPTTAEELEAIRARPLIDTLPDDPASAFTVHVETDPKSHVVEVDEEPEPEPDDVGDVEPERPPRYQELVDQFKGAIGALLPLAARPSATFAGLFAPDDLDMLSNFLKQVAAASERQARAGEVAEHLN